MSLCYPDIRPVSDEFPSGIGGQLARIGEARVPDGRHEQRDGERECNDGKQDRVVSEEAQSRHCEYADTESTWHRSPSWPWSRVRIWFTPEMQSDQIRHSR